MSVTQSENLIPDPQDTYNEGIKIINQYQENPQNEKEFLSKVENVSNRLLDTSLPHAYKLGEELVLRRAELEVMQYAGFSILRDTRITEYVVDQLEANGKEANALREEIYRTLLRLGDGSETFFYAVHMGLYTEYSTNKDLKLLYEYTLQIVRSEAFKKQHEIYEKEYKRENTYDEFKGLINQARRGLE